MPIHFTLTANSPIVTRQRDDGKWQAFSRKSPDWLLADGASTEQEAIRKGFMTYGSRFSPTKRAESKVGFVAQ